MMLSTLRPSSEPFATASRSMSPVEMAGTPRCSPSTWACVPLPAPGGPSRTTREPRPPAGASSTPSPTNPAPLHEAFVVAHHELALDLLDRIHRDADDDEQRRAAEVELDAQTLGEPVGEIAGDLRAEPRNPRHVNAGEQELRQHGHRRQVDRSHQRQPGQDA